MLPVCLAVAKASLTSLVCRPQALRGLCQMWNYSKSVRLGKALPALVLSGLTQ